MDLIVIDPHGRTPRKGQITEDDFQQDHYPKHHRRSEAL